MENAIIILQIQIIKKIQQIITYVEVTDQSIIQRNHYQMVKNNISWVRNNYYSEINRIAQIISNTKNNASGVVTVSDPNLKVTVKLLQEYFANNKEDLSTLVNKIKTTLAFIELPCSKWILLVILS